MELITMNKQKYVICCEAGRKGAGKTLKANLVLPFVFSSSKSH